MPNHSTETTPHDAPPLAMERHGIAHVDSSRRHGRALGQFTVRFAPVIYLAGIFVGSTGDGLGLDLWGSVTAIVLANLLGSIGTGLCATMGPRLGMPQLPMGRSCFGYVGNFLPALLSLVVFIGYYTVGTILGATSLADLFHTPYRATVIVVAAASIVIGVVGYRLLHLFGHWITNISIVVLAGVSVALVFHGVGHGAEATVSGHDYWLAWLVQFTIVFGYTVSWAPYASDYSRYLPEETSSGSIFVAATSGLFAATTWMMVLGAVLVTSSPDGDVMGAFSIALPDWLRYVVLLTLGLAAIPHNSVNLYSGAMATLTCDVKLPQTVTVAIAGVVGTILAVFFGGDDFRANFGLFLIVISYYIAPWLAILAVDYFAVHRNGRAYGPISGFYDRYGEFGGVNVAGVTALLAGIVVSIPFIANELYTGPVARAMSGADFSYFISAAVAAGIYWSANRRTQSLRGRASS